MIIAFDVLSGIFEADAGDYEDALEDAVDASEDFADGSEDLTDTLEGLEPASEDAGEATEDLGEGIGDTVGPSEDLDEALEDVTDTAEDATGAAGDLSDGFGDAAEGADGVGDASEGASDSLDDLAGGADDAADSLGEIEDSADGASGAVEDVSESLDGAAGATFNISDGAEDAAGSLSEIDGGAAAAGGAVGGLVGDLEDGSDAAADMSDETEDLAGSLDTVEGSAMAAGGAMMGLGAAGIAAVDSTSDTREGLNRTAVTMGMTREEANELSREISNATYPIEDAEGALGSLATQGDLTKQELRETAIAADDLADATGTTATSVAENAGPAIRAFGHDIDDLNEHMDTFTWITHNTTMDVEEFSGAVERMAPDLQELGLTLDETAVYMAALEEQGITGRQAITEMRQASNAAEGDQDKFKEELGLTNQELDAQRQSLNEAEGSTEEYATSANEATTVVDELTARYDDFMMSIGASSDMVETASIVVGGLGMALTGLATVAPAVASGLGTLAGAAGTIGTAILSLNPIVLGAIAVIGTLALAWNRNWFNIQERTAAGVSFVKNNIGELPGWLNTQKDRLLGTFDELAEGGPSRAREMTSGITSSVLGWNPRPAVAEKKDQIMDSLPSVSDFTGRGSALVTGFADGIRDSIGEATGAASDLAGGVRDRLPFSPAREGPLQDLDDTGPALVETVADSAEGRMARAEDVGNSLASRLQPNPEGNAGGGGGGSNTLELKHTFDTGDEDFDDWLSSKIHTEVENKEELDIDAITGGVMN